VSSNLTASISRMIIRFTDPRFKLYRFFIGEKEIPFNKVIEANDEEGWIQFLESRYRLPDITKKEYGRVFIVRFEDNEDEGESDASRE